jgi:hypothetical protein
MRQFIGNEIRDIHFVIPRSGNRKLHNRLSFEQLILQSGETLFMRLRKAWTYDYQTLDPAS